MPQIITLNSANANKSYEKLSSSRTSKMYTESLLKKMNTEDVYKTSSTCKKKLNTFHEPSALENYVNAGELNENSKKEPL